LTFRADSPILLAATVGRATPPVGITIGRRVAGPPAPPYEVMTVVAATGPGVRGRPHFAGTANVSRGDTALIQTLVSGAFAKRPQTVVVTVARGPGNVLTVTAGVPGRSPAQARFTNSTGAPVALADVGYTCTVPPATTICPAVSAEATPSHYKLAFAVAAGTVIVLYARVSG
jgi:hypothetical protein